MRLNLFKRKPIIPPTNPDEYRQQLRRLTIREIATHIAAPLGPHSSDWTKEQKERWRIYQEVLAMVNA